MSKEEKKECKRLLKKILLTIYGKEDLVASGSAISGQETFNEPGGTLDLKQEFIFFIAKVPAARLNRYLRKLLMDYLYYRKEELPEGFKEGLHDLYWLMDLLDKIQLKTPAVLHSKAKIT